MAFKKLGDHLKTSLQNTKPDTQSLMSSENSKSSEIISSQLAKPTRTGQQLIETGSGERRNMLPSVRLDTKTAMDLSKLEIHSLPSQLRQTLALSLETPSKLPEVISQDAQQQALTWLGADACAAENQISKPELAKLMALLSAATTTQSNISESDASLKLEVYHDALKECHRTDIYAAFRQASLTCKWFPALSEIVHSVEQVAKTRENWRFLMKIIAGVEGVPKWIQRIPSTETH